MRKVSSTHSLIYTLTTTEQIRRWVVAHPWIPKSISISSSQRLALAIKSINISFLVLPNENDVNTEDYSMSHVKIHKNT